MDSFAVGVMGQAYARALKLLSIAVMLGVPARNCDVSNGEWDEQYEKVDHWLSLETTKADQEAIIRKLCATPSFQTVPVCQLIAEVTLEVLYTEDEHVDQIADYVFTHKEEYYNIIDEMLAMIGDDE